MASTNVRAWLISCFAVCLIVVAGMVSGPAVQKAYAESGQLEAANLEEGVAAGEPAEPAEPVVVETAPKAQVKYAVCAGSPWIWNSDGKTAKVSKKKQFTGLKLKLNAKTSGSIQYQTYVHGYGWQSVKKNGKVAGATGKKAERIEVVRIALTGKISQWYNVEYRVLGSDGTWQAWKKNGQKAGKYKAKLRAIQVKLTEKPAKSATAGTGIIGVRYRAKQVGSSWQKWMSNNSAAGKAAKKKNVKNFAIALDKGTSSGSIRYRVRLSDGTWEAWKKDGKSVGNHSDIEAIQIKLTGKLAKTYDVVYRTYVRGVGWQARVRNGATAGTAKGRGIYSIKVQLVKKTARDGWVGSGKNWSYYKKGKKQVSTWIKTTESPINVMTAKSKRYWLDSSGKLAVNRIVDPAVKKDAKAGYAACATKWGYALVNGKRETTKGFVLADGNGKLVAAAGWLKSDTFDGVEEKYRMVSIGSYAVAKTGFFKVGGNKYYGDPDEGYVIRDMAFNVGDKWYVAKESGAIGSASTLDVIIERYVRWAINIANDDSHGYTQDLEGRWGPDYDCSSLVISALKSAGLSTGDAVYTGNMRSELTSHGFVWNSGTSKLKRGDILLVHREGGRQHTEIYLGKGKTVGAHIAETGGVFGRTGDQTGHEIDVGPYYSIWQGYLRLGKPRS